MVIMRIHYAWKEWFAKEQSGDFIWRQPWDPLASDSGILCHNFPYDIYSVKGSCGPHADTCLQFNFASIPGRYRYIKTNSSKIHHLRILNFRDLFSVNILAEQYQ